MIKLVYIRGISDYDTLHFSSKLTQYDYFDNMNGLEIDAYYPPHYKNTIKFDRDDVDDISQYNYLILYTSNKQYFYFLGKRRYINEDVYEIDIEMDTIQTYMFDIVFNSSLVHRMSINRWVMDGPDRKINRDYIRENYSNGEFINLDKKTFYTDSIHNYWFVITSTSRIVTGTPCEISLRDDLAYNSFSGKLYVYVVPLVNNANTQCVLTKGSGESAVSVTIDRGNLDKLVSQTGIVDARLIYSPKIMQMLDCTYSSTYNEFTFSDNSKVELGADGAGFGVCCVTRICFPITEKIFNLIGDANNPEFFTLSHNTGNNFNWRYIPQLLDSNYFRINYGDETMQGGYPYERITTQYIRLRLQEDFLQGHRRYKLFSSGDIGLENRYNQNITITSQETLNVFRNYWNEYQAYNQGTVAARLVNSFVSMYSGGESLLNQGGTRSYGVAGTLELFTNLYFSPDEIVQGNTFMLDYLSNYIKPIYFVSYVEDIEYVATCLEYYGYKVSKLTNQNLFEYCKKRYYYNVVSATNMNIDLSILSSTEILDDIKTRFNNGLRLWDMEHNSYITEGLKYDNVELEELS